MIITLDAYDNAPVRVLVNPTREAVLNLLERELRPGEDQVELKGVIHRGRLLLWDGWDCTHSQMWEQLGEGWASVRDYSVSITIEDGELEVVADMPKQPISLKLLTR